MQRSKVKWFLISMHEGEKEIIYNIIAVGVAKDQFTIWEVSERSDSKTVISNSVGYYINAWAGQHIPESYPCYSSLSF